MCVVVNIRIVTVVKLRSSNSYIVSYPDCFRRLHFIYGEKRSGILPMREFFHPYNHKYAND